MAEVMDEKNATVKRLELLEEGVDLGEKGLTVGSVGDDGVNHLVMAVDHFLELVFPSLVAALCQPRCGKQLVGDAAKGADDDYNLLMFEHRSTMLFKLRMDFTEPTDVPPNFNTFIMFLYKCYYSAPLLQGGKC